MSMDVPEDDRPTDDLQLVRQNIYPASRSAIGNWATFAWHRDRSGRIDTNKIHSSQALAIDVFGAIATAEARDEIVDAIALVCGVKTGGPWRIAFEWIDPARVLRELRSTQVDVLLLGRESLIVVECKFTEAAGSCSQVKPLSSGRHKGLRQCNGRYLLQTNPVNGSTAKCALTAKGIRYWEVVPEVLQYPADQEHDPCPFRTGEFQWMRNLVLAHELGRTLNKEAALIIAHATGGPFHTEVVAAAGFPLPMTGKFPAPLFMGYQELINTAAAVDPVRDWQPLHEWVEMKVDAARQRS